MQYSYCKNTSTNNKSNPKVSSWSIAEIEAMMNKRNKSGVPSGVLVGQIPEDNRWKFYFEFDVDPYLWRSSCSPYKSGVT